MIKLKCFGVFPDRAEGLVALFDDVLQLSQHCDLCVLQLQLLGGGVRDASAIRGLCFDRLRRQTRNSSLSFICSYLSNFN